MVWQDAVIGLRLVDALGVAVVAVDLDPDTGADLWERIADFAIAPLIGAWAVQKMVTALAGLSGRKLPIVASANQLALIALVAIVGRMVIEDVASHWYPERLAAVVPEKLPYSSAKQRIASASLRTGVFLLAAVPFVGNVIQLYLGAALFMLPQLVKIYEDNLPNRPAIHRWMPKGIVKTVSMLFIGGWVTAAVTAGTTNPRTALADSFFLLSLPGLVLTVVGFVARDSDERPRTSVQRLAGAGVLAVGLAYVIGGLH